MATASALDTQCRVIVALALREVHTINGGKTLGYLWVLLRAAFNLAVFWTIRHFMHATAPHGMTMLTYLVAGFGTWYIVAQTLSKCMAAIDGNRALLTFPQVTPLDIMFARTLVTTATQVVAMTIILCFGIVGGYPITISNTGLLISCVLFAAMLGLGAGTILGSLAIYLPALQHIVPMFMRLLFFTSGVFFSVSAFSHRIGDFLMLNPIMQLIELTRMSLATGYVSPYADLWYVVECVLVTLASGLLLERYARRKVTQ